MTLFKGNGSKENIPSINSSGNALFVYFTSNGSVSESGFSATYYTNRVGKKKFLLITCRHTINLFIFTITTYRLIWTFSNFLDSWLILVFIDEKTTQLKIVKYNEKWKYSSKYKCKLCKFFFWTVWPFTLWMFLTYTILTYTHIYLRLYLQSYKRFSVSVI